MKGPPFGNALYIKRELKQQTNRALTFIKAATEGAIHDPILQFSHTAEYMAAQLHASGYHKCTVPGLFFLIILSWGGFLPCITVPICCFSS